MQVIYKLLKWSQYWTKTSKRLYFLHNSRRYVKLGKLVRQCIETIFLSL